MTSPSPKKHRTTAPNINQATTPDGEFGVPNSECGAVFDRTVPPLRLRVPQSEFRNAETWLPAALLATLVLLTGALQAFGGDSGLKWQRASTPSRPVTPHYGTAPVRHIVTGERDARGYNVVQVAYNEEGGWSRTGGQPTGSATLKSVVVHPADDNFGASRVAQLPFDDDNTRDELDAELERQLIEPFDEPEDPTTPDDLPELPDSIGELPEPQVPTEPDDTTQPRDPEPPTTPQIIRPRDPDPVDPDDRDPFERSDNQRDDPTDDETPTTTSRDREKAKRLEEDRREAQESCSTELANLRGSRIASIDLSINVTGQEGRDYPFECSIDEGEVYAGRCWPQVTYMWKAAANCHKPLYFEQVQLERYGHSCGPCLQPLVSGAHFFTRLPVLPYCKGLYPPNECLYPLGYYRPGNCAPYMVDAVPFTWRAVLFQATATVGTAGILP